MTKFSISIVTYNNEKTIGSTLFALTENWPAGIDISCYLIDNASTDDTIQKLFPYVNKLKIILSERGNIGFGAAHNTVIDRIDSDYHIIMNPDVLIQDSGMFKMIATFMAANPDIGMLVPRIEDENGELQYLCRRELTVLDLALRFMPGNFMSKRLAWHEMRDKNYDQPFDVPFASGCFMVIRTGLLKQLQGFDERFFLYSEDADLSRRVNQLSRIVYYPEITVCHKWERASYKNWQMTKLHLKSLWQYFRKWGFKLI